jgi:hypothetical protein
VLIEAIALALSAGLLIGERFIFSFGRASAQPSADQRLAEDARAPVLLRAFRSDGALAEKDWLNQASLLAPLLGRPTFEERLAQVMEDVGPPIALGRPQDLLPRVGFSRQYIVGDDWERALRAVQGDGCVRRSGDGRRGPFRFAMVLMVPLGCRRSAGDAQTLVKDSPVCGEALCRRRGRRAELHLAAGHCVSP